MLNSERMPVNRTSIRLTIRASNEPHPKQFALQQFTVHLEDPNGRKKFVYFRQRQFIATLQIGEITAPGTSQHLASFRNKGGGTNGRKALWTFSDAEKRNDVEFLVLPLLPGLKVDQNEGSLLYSTPPPEGIQIHQNLTLIGAFPRCYSHLRR